MASSFAGEVGLSKIQVAQQSLLALLRYTEGRKRRESRRERE
jgi:hypothetical protein